MSASAIADALETMLSAASVFGDGNVTIGDYKVLETTSACCAVIEWSAYDSEATAFGGGNRERAWIHQVAAFVKDRGNPVALAAGVLSTVDMVIDCLDADDSLQGTVESVDGVRASRDLREALTVGGMAWLPVFIDIETTEYSA